MSDDELRLPHHFPNAPETDALVAELEANGSPLCAKAATALRTMNARMSDLEDTLSFAAENGGHLLVLTNSEEHMDLAAKYQSLVDTSRAAPEIEIDDGQAVFRSGPVSITVTADAAVVYNAYKRLPARRIELSHDRFFADAEELFRKD